MEARKAKEHTWAKGRKYETKLYVPCFFNQVLHTEGGERPLLAHVCKRSTMQLVVRFRSSIIGKSAYCTMRCDRPTMVWGLKGKGV